MVSGRTSRKSSLRYSSTLDRQTDAPCLRVYSLRFPRRQRSRASGRPGPSLLRRYSNLRALACSSHDKGMTLLMGYRSSGQVTTPRQPIALGCVCLIASQWFQILCWRIQLPRALMFDIRFAFESRPVSQDYHCRLH